MTKGMCFTAAVILTLTLEANAAPPPPGGNEFAPGSAFVVDVSETPPRTDARPLVAQASSSGRRYRLKTDIAGTGAGTVSGSGSYVAGAAVVLTATPAAGSSFAGWSPSPCAATFTMPAEPLTCTATFALNGSSSERPRWRLLNPGFVPDGQYSAEAELGAAFDPVRNRIFTFDWQGGAWVYDLVGADSAVIRPLNDEQPIRGQSRNCSLAYLPTLDVVVTNLCGSSSNPPDGFAVFNFPDVDTVVTTHQCLVYCGGPYTANFIAWNASLGAVVGGGGWAGSTGTIHSYPLSNGLFPPPETPWVLLPQSGPAPAYPPADCDICKEALRRTVLRNDQYVYVDPLSHDLYTYDFATEAWAFTSTVKPGPLPMNGVVGYDPVRDILVVWVGSNALYGSGPVTQQTWIYSFATNEWNLGPNGAAGDTTPGYANAVLSYMVWDSNLLRLILITTDEVASGFTRLWTLDWIAP